MSTDPQRQSVPRVSAAVVAVADPDDAEPPADDIEREETVQHLYAAGLAKLGALHEKWAAALAELQDWPVSSSPREAA